MIRHSANGVAFYQFEGLNQYSEVQHAVFTRLGGSSQGAFSSLNVGSAVGDDPAAVDSNLARIYRTLELTAQQVVTARQVHGAQIACVAIPQQGSSIPTTDGLIAREQGIALLLRFADCQPLLLYDAQRHAIGLVHAGWRGVMAGVVPSAVSALQRAFGCQPQDLLACLGPSIGPCCYEVGADMVAHMEHAFGTHDGLLLRQSDGSLHFDLPAAVRRQLQDTGVQRIESSSLCTACRTDEFYSHRAEHGHTGRFAVLLALRAAALCGQPHTQKAQA